MTNSDFDFIVLGAGISGLLLASQLSKKHSVLIIEKEKTDNFYKYWLTDKDSYDVNPDLKECINNEYNFLDYIGYDYTSYRCSGKYILWDSVKLVSHFMDALQAKNVVIIRPSRFYTYHLSRSHIQVYANDKTFTGKLLIDCMGHSSPIVSAKKVMSILGYYFIYGSTLKLKSKIDPIAFHNVMLKSCPSYLEIFPTSNDYAYATLIVPERKKYNFSSLKEEFDFIVKQTKYTSYFDHESESRMLGGIIPVGVLKKKGLDRIFFYGESGQANPAATATGLTIMLKTYKEVSDYLSYMLLNNKISGKELSSNAPELYNKYLKRVQLHFFKDFIKWNSDQFLNLINECNELSHDDFINGLVFGSINPMDYIKSGFLKTLYQTRKKIIFRYILKSFLL